MRKLILSSIALAAWGATAAQSVTTSPAIITQDTQSITITLHTDGGNRGLLGLSPSDAVYAHTGLITSASTSGSDWKYAPKWGDNSAKYKLTPAGTDTYTLTIPDIREFYGVEDASETIDQMVFVFRNTAGTAEAKSAVGGDIRVKVFPSGYPRSAERAYPGGKPVMGAVRASDGSVTFCIAAPGKSDATIVGSWNDYATPPSSAMYKTVYEGNTYFWTTVTGLEPGKDYPYYYIIDGASFVGDPYARLVLDQYDSYIPSSVFPDIPAYPGRVTNVPVAVYNSARDDYDWEVTDFRGVRQSDLIIYELLLRDFTGTESASKGDGNVILATEKLDYLKELGVNAIELLPIMEFAGNNSWGYNTNFYMAPDKAYGTPSDYRRFIDEAHKRGMAVILDIVFNQSDAWHPWYDLYTRKDNPFYNGSAPHAYSVLNDWNQDCPLVQQQWRDALDYWMTAYKVDGFRFDLVKGLGDNDSYGNTFNPATGTWGTPTDDGTNRYNASRVARMKELHASMRRTNPAAYFINENLAGAQEENQMAEDGEINWANINYQACQYAMGYVDDDASLDRFYAPLDSRTWGSTVSYAESHDEERVAYKMKQYGKTEVKSLNPMMLRLGSVAAQMILSPGAHMIWQFEEIGNDQTTKNANGGNNTDPKRVNWNMLKSAPRKGLYDTYAALNTLRTLYPDMFREDVKTSVSLSSATARTIALAKDDSELYLLVNPSVSAEAVIPVPANPLTGASPDLSAGYELVAKSYNTTPVPSAQGVRIPANSFAVYARNLHSSIGAVAADDTTQPRIAVDGGFITVLTPYTTLAVYNLGGVRVDETRALAPGVYIVAVDGKPLKAVVR